MHDNGLASKGTLACEKICHGFETHRNELVAFN